MKQLTWRGVATGGWRRDPGPAPDPRVAAELAVIGEVRRAAPPEPGSVRPVIRPITAHDGPALEEMALRCSADTLRRRFHGPAPRGGPSRIAGLLAARDAEEHLVAEVDGAIVRIGTLHRSPRPATEGEIAMLVEDAWQGTGLGHRLTGHLLRRARERGMEVVVAEVLREPAYVLDRLSHAAERTTVEYDGPVATVRIPVRAGGAATAAT